MKNKNNLLLVSIKYGLEVIWYVSLVAISITTVKFLTQLVRSSKYDYTIPIILPVSTMERYYPSFSTNGSDISIHAHSGSLSISTSNPIGEISSIITFLIFKILFLAIIYNFRNVIKSSLNKQTFNDENIKRMKWTAFLIFLFAPFDLIQSLIRYFILRSYTQKFAFDWSIDILSIFMLSGFVYIAAEIIRHGFEIKKENEEFV